MPKAELQELLQGMSQQQLRALLANAPAAAAPAAAAAAEPAAEPAAAPGDHDAAVVQGNGGVGNLIHNGALVEAMPDDPYANRNVDADVIAGVNQGAAAARPAAVAAPAAPGGLAAAAAPAAAAPPANAAMGLAVPIVDVLGNPVLPDEEPHMRDDWITEYEAWMRGNGHDTARQQGVLTPTLITCENRV